MSPSESLVLSVLALKIGFSSYSNRFDHYWNKIHLQICQYPFEENKTAKCSTRQYRTGTGHRRDETYYTEYRYELNRIADLILRHDIHNHSQCHSKKTRTPCSHVINELNYKLNKKPQKQCGCQYKFWMFFHSHLKLKFLKFHPLCQKNVNVNVFLFKKLGVSPRHDILWYVSLVFTRTFWEFDFCSPFKACLDFKNDDSNLITVFPKFSLIRAHIFLSSHWTEKIHEIILAVVKVEIDFLS